jgi:hypothetical protein
MSELLVAVGNPTTRFFGPLTEPSPRAGFFCSYCAILIFFKHRTGMRRLRRFIVGKPADQSFCSAVLSLKRPEGRLPEAERNCQIWLL